MSFCTMGRNCLQLFQGVDDKKMREEVEQSVSEWR